MAPLKVAVLINTFPSPYSQLVRGSFTASVATAAPGSEVNFYDPIHAQLYPDPAVYDLVVLSGGTADPMGNDAWVIKLRTWVKATMEGFPELKMVGICWGHQHICVTFGGIVGSMEDAEVCTHLL
jgi:GMP synthase-like glutamine amidotransferase